MWHHSDTDSYFASFFHFRDPCVTLGSPGEFRILSLSWGQMISNLNFICNLNTPLPHTQVLGIRTWASLGNIVLPTTSIYLKGLSRGFSEISLKDFAQCLPWCKYSINASLIVVIISLCLQSLPHFPPSLPFVLHSELYYKSHHALLIFSSYSDSLLFFCFLYVKSLFSDCCVICLPSECKWWC